MNQMYIFHYGDVLQRWVSMVLDKVCWFHMITNLYFELNFVIYLFFQKLTEAAKALAMQFKSIQELVTLK
jgi:hypothetical protein